MASPRAWAVVRTPDLRHSIVYRDDLLKTDHVVAWFLVGDDARAACDRYDAEVAVDRERLARAQRGLFE